MWFLNDSDGQRVLWLRPNQEFIIGKRNKQLQGTDPSMSRTHATLNSCGTSVIVKDCNSTHGTWVKKGNSDFKREKQISLEHNDRVRFGILRVYTIFYVEMTISYSSVSSHDLIKLNHLSAKYDLILKKDLQQSSICLICGGNVFSAKKALALVMQIPVVSLDWLYGWDDVDSYSFEIPDFEKYLPAAFQVKNEILEKDLWKVNSHRKVMLESLEFILSGEKQNLDMTKNVIIAAGGTASIQSITLSNVSRLRKGVILVCESDMIALIKAEGLNTISITQDDLGVAIMKGVLDLDRFSPVKPLIPKASLINLASLDLFEDMPSSIEEPTVSENNKRKIQVPPVGKNIDVFNLFDEGSSLNSNHKINVENSEPRKISCPDTKNAKVTSNLKSVSKVADAFDIFNDDILDNPSEIKNDQDDKKILKSDKDSMIKKDVLTSTRVKEDSSLIKQINIPSNTRLKKKIDLDSFFDSLLNVDDDLQSQDPAVRENSIEEQKDSIDSPLRIVKEENVAPFGTLKGKTTSLAERLGFQPIPKDENIPSSLPPSKKYAAEPFISEGSDVVDIVVPATPIKPYSKQIVQKSPVSIKTESNHQVSSSMRNQELIKQALERGVSPQDVEMVDSTKSLCRIIFSDYLIVKKPKYTAIPVESGMNTKRFVSNRVQRLAILGAKPPPIEMIPHHAAAVDNDTIGKKQSRITSGKKRTWPGFSSEEEKE